MCTSNKSHHKDQFSLWKIFLVANKKNSSIKVLKRNRCVGRFCLQCNRVNLALSRTANRLFFVENFIFHGRHIAFLYHCWISKVKTIENTLHLPDNWKVLTTKKYSIYQNSEPLYNALKKLQFVQCVVLELIDSSKNSASLRTTFVRIWNCFWQISQIQSICACYHHCKTSRTGYHIHQTQLV